MPNNYKRFSLLYQYYWRSMLLRLTFHSKTVTFDILLRCQNKRSPFTLRKITISHDKTTEIPNTKRFSYHLVLMYVFFLVWSFKYKKNNFVEWIYSTIFLGRNQRSKVLQKIIEYFNETNSFALDHLVVASQIWVIANSSYSEKWTWLSLKSISLRRYFLWYLLNNFFNFFQ